MPDTVFDQSCDTGVSETGRALVPLTLRPGSATEPCPAIRPDARFVVQLIANANARTLAQHRVAPQDVATTYSDVSVRGEFRLGANGLALARVA
jgi:hypothetical protein